MTKQANANWFHDCMVENRIQVWLGTPNDNESELVFEIDKSLFPALAKKLNLMLGKV